MKRRGIKKGVYIVPNLLTTGNLFCGFFSIIRAINGDYVTAAWAILFAGVFDFLDGLVARITKGQSEFGLEYDSLVDLCSFGLAPALLIYMWVLFQFKRIGWTVAFLFFACGALRLARYNVQVANVEKKGFQGLPIPGAAYTLAGYVIFHHHVFGATVPESYLLLIFTFLLALLMVSSIPYRSFKVLDLNRRASFFLLVLFVGVLFILASAPQVMIFILAVMYVGVGVIEGLIHSPKKIRSFADLLARFFHEAPEELAGEEEKKEERVLKVVE